MLLLFFFNEQKSYRDWFNEGILQAPKHLASTDNFNQVQNIWLIFFVQILQL